MVTPTPLLPKDAPRLVRRNYGRGHGYQLDGEKIVGVTTAIGVLDKPALRNWYAEEAAKRAVNEWERLTELPITERLDYIKRGARDKTTAAALRGTQIHTLGQSLAHGEDVDVPPEHVGPVEAYARFLDKWDIQPLASETPLANLTHKYGGTADLWGTIGKRDNAAALIDIKTGKGIYSETGLQLAGYRYSDLIQIDGAEVVTPQVDLVYVAHVLPDDVRMLPVVADERVFRQFLYVLQAYRATEEWKDWPLIGSGVTPDGTDDA